ncbi:MAG: hypothetical protein V3U14_11445 [candidate division NC10 bacterium]
MHKLQARWMDSVERALEVFERYATDDQGRKVGAVAYVDPLTVQAEPVDATKARVCYRQLERAFKAAQLTDTEGERYVVARERLLLALKPGGMGQVGEAVSRGQRLQGDAVVVSPWMIQAFAKAYHLHKGCTENGLITCELFTVCHVMASLGRRLPSYALDTLEAQFRAPVYFGDSITPLADVQEILDGGKAVLRLSAVNQDGKVVCEGTATLRPEKPGEILHAPPAELKWVKQWVQDVTPAVPPAVYDFTDPSTPRQQTFTKSITPELVRATQVLFGPLYPHQLSPLLAIGTMAMASGESSPGHLLLTARVLHFRGPIEAGEELILVATPPPNQIRHFQNGNGTPIVPLEIAVTNRWGGLVLQGQVVKLMEGERSPS